MARFCLFGKRNNGDQANNIQIERKRRNLIVRGPFKNWSILKRLSKYVLVNHVELAVKHCTEMLFEFP